MRVALFALLLLFLLAGCKSESGGAIANAPPAPASVAAVAGDQSVTVTWSGVSNAGQYNLHISTDPGFGSASSTTVANVTSPYVHNSLVNDTTYYYAVTAIGDGGESGFSMVASATPIAPPSKPSSLLLISSVNDVTLQWADVPGANHYTLYMAAEPRITRENIKTLSGWAIIDDITSPYTHTGLLPGVTYYFVLVASNPSGSSLLSNEVSGILVPQAPVISTVTAMDKQIKIEWSAVSGAQAYNLYLATETGITPENFNTKTDGKSFTSVSSPMTVNGLINGKTYYFVLTASNANGESAISAESQAIPVNQSPIATGTDHTCATLDDHSLWCWGYNNEGQLGIGTFGTGSGKTSPTRVGGGNQWNYIAAGQQNTCGLQIDGSLWCWGANGYGQIGDGTEGSSTRKLEPTQIAATESWASVTLGFAHVCGLTRAGKLQCWGYGGDGQVGDGNSNYSNSLPVEVKNSILPWFAVDAGDSHTCAIMENHTLWCWGYGNDGQLGDGGNSNHNVPVSVDGSWDKVSAGGMHTCAIRTDGTLRCWGDNSFGQLGNGASGASAGSLVPDVVNSTLGWKDVTAGRTFTCGIKTDGSLWCWGQNTLGQLAQGATVSQDSIITPTRVGSASNWVSVKSGGYGDHVCAYNEDNSYWCWGNNEYGQLGKGTTVDGTNQYSVVPTPVNADSDWASMSAGKQYTCTLKTDNSLWCWGDNLYGILGDNSQVDKPKPLQIDNSSWLEVVAGRTHTCGIKDDHSLWCWGDNNSGKLGLGPTAGSIVLTPQQVGSDADWMQVSPGEYHTCALKTNGTAYCWGYGWYGRLGQTSADQTDKDVPTPVVTGLTFSHLSVGRDHTCAIAQDQTLWCWGRNGNGQLGQSNYTTLYEPTQAGVDADWLSVKSSYAYTCGIKAALDIDTNPTNRLVCWGRNYDGELGDGTTTSRFLADMEATGVGFGFRSVSTFDNHTCAVKDDDTLWCWGMNDHGTIGNGVDNGTYSPIDTPDPQQIGGAEWSTVSAGFNHTCGFKLNGTLWCWGENNNGQLGNGSAWSSELLQVQFN